MMSIAYSLYVDGDDGRQLVEKTKPGEPFQFISGFGVALEAFEQQLTSLEPGASFDFSIPKEQAYGDYYEDRVLDLERDMFVVDGCFDHAHIFPEAIIPLQNEEGTRFLGKVLEVGDTKVKVDLNHPLAGETLHFKGEVLENREATEAEINQLMKQLAGGCGGNCGGCGGGCEGDCEGGCNGGCNGGCK